MPRVLGTALCVFFLCGTLLFCVAYAQQRQLATFIQVADPHLELDYVVGSSPVCDMPLCCLAMNATITQKAGPFGDYLCDIPYSMVESALQFVATKKPEFVIWTGDSPSHRVWDDPPDWMFRHVKNMTDAFAQLLPGMAVYPIIGNHDTSPTDEVPPAPRSDWLFSGLLDMWSGMIPPEGHANFQIGGYYSNLVEPGFRLVSLNTQWMDTLNFWMWAEITDAGQYDWFKATLESSRQAGEKVLVHAHIPFTPIDFGPAPKCLVPYCEKMLDLIANYSDVIVGTVHGHVHTDFWRILHDKRTNQPVSMLWISPALTTYQNLNPTVREFVYDKQTKEIVDIRTYYTDLSEDKTSITWQLEYSMVDAYDIPDLRPTTMQVLVDRMRGSEPSATALLAKSRLFFTNSFGPGPCDKSCQKEWLCVLSTAYMSDMHECLSATSA